MSASKRSSSSSSSSSAGISASSNGAAPASTDPPPTKIARTVFKPYCFVSISSQVSSCVLTSYVKICWIDMPYGKWSMRSRASFPAMRWILLIADVYRVDNPPEPAELKAIVWKCNLTVHCFLCQEELDKQTLLFQNRKLTERIEQRRKAEAELLGRIEQLEKRQINDDAVLCVINRCELRLIDMLQDKYFDFVSLSGTPL